MTAGLVEKASKVGKVALYPIDGLLVEVSVTDMKTAWGNVRYKIEPVSGSGEKWVDESSLRWG